MAGSRWVKLDSDYPDNPKIHSLSNAAFRVHVTLIAYCAKELTDGHVSRHGLKVVLARSQLGHSTGYRVVHALVQAGLLEPCDDGWMLHDFLTMNPQLERTVVEARRKRWRSHKTVNGTELPGWNPQQVPRS